jgi:putative MATE family efflux protein
MEEVVPPPAASGAPPPGASPKPLWRVFLVFLAPMMLANVLQSASGTINNVFVGQMLGVEALASATVFFPVLFFLIAFIIGIGAGSSILIGQAYGRRDMERVRHIAGVALMLTLILGALVAAFGGALAGPLMTGLGTPPDILDEAIGYARIMLVSAPVLFVFILMTSILRGVGDTMTPLWTLVMSTLAGLLITPAFIQGWMGLPRLGVASAAVASFLSLVVAMIWLAFYLRAKKHPLAPDAQLLTHVRLDPKILALILRLGVPTGVQMVIIAIAELVLLGLVNSHGPSATASYGAINQVLAYVQFPAMSIGITASILAAQAIGAGRIHQLGAITRTGLLLNLIITGAGVIVVYVFSHAIIAMFIASPTLVDETTHLLGIVLWSVVIFGWSVMFSSMMRASGTVLWPMALSILAILGVEAPTAIILNHTMGMDGIYIAYPATFCAMMTMQASFYLFVWRRRTITAMA